jgi:hypothetical protein
MTTWLDDVRLACVQHDPVSLGIPILVATVITARPVGAGSGSAGLADGRHTTGAQQKPTT